MFSLFRFMLEKCYKLPFKTWKILGFGYVILATTLFPGGPGIFHLAPLERVNGRVNGKIIQVVPCTPEFKMRFSSANYYTRNVMFFICLFVNYLMDSFISALCSMYHASANKIRILKSFQILLTFFTCTLLLGNF